MGHIVLVTGGTRSGKSEFAEKYTEHFNKPVVYVATASANDAEMEMRIKIHRERRPSTWKTIEETVKVSDKIRKYGNGDNVILLDCLTFFITNLLFRNDLPEDEDSFKHLEEEILTHVHSLLNATREKDANLIIVSNESGLGLIPPDRLSRKYQEIVGRANQIAANEADEVYLVIAGHPIEIKEKGQKILNKVRREG